ncbi:MAG: VPLPA-CTERM sorting domain-containing protein [Gammaproteobacteria bacterium]
MNKKHIKGLLLLTTLLGSLNANALLFTSDLTTAVGDDGSDIPGVYNIGGAHFADGFMQTLSGITMTVDNAVAPGPTVGRINSGNEFIGAPHGFFVGGGTGASSTEFDATTQFSISFTDNVILNAIFFDDVGGRANNVAPQFTLNGGTYTTLDVETGHDINSSITDPGWLTIGTTLLANTNYIINVLPDAASLVADTGGNSLAEFWGWDVTQTAAVPLPAAVWFLLGGIATLFGFGRKKQQA